MRRYSIGACAVALIMPACVAGDANSLYCVDWNANGVDECADPVDPQDTDGAGPSEPPQPCDMIDDAVGGSLVLGGYTVGSIPWLGDDESQYVFQPAFPPQWVVQGSGGSDTPSSLMSVPDGAGQHTLSVTNAATSPGDYLWIQADGADWAELSLEPDAWPATRLDLPDGSAYWYVPSGFGDGNATGLVWNLGGDSPFTVRGSVNMLGRATWAGPGVGSMVSTTDGDEEGGRSWLPASANCRSIAAGADDTGTPPDPDTGSPEPEPMPEPEDPEPPPGAFDPCELIGGGEVSQPPGFSPAWLATNDEERAVLNRWVAPTNPAKPWFWGPVAEHPGQPAVTAPALGFSFVLPTEQEVHAAAWVIVEADWLDDAGAESILLHSLGADVEAQKLQLEDGAWLAYVMDPWAESSAWVITGFPQVRGWALDGGPGVMATVGDPATATVAAGWAWMPAAGYCDAPAPVLDETG